MLADYHTWHYDVNISRSISGTSSYVPGDFSFDIGDGGSLTFLDRTFSVDHVSDGTKTVSYTVHYGVTSVGTFGDNKSCSDSLTLTRIPKRPAAPGGPSFSNIQPTSVTVTWNASPDDNGSPINSYILRRWTGGSMSGDYVDSYALNRLRNVTGLKPGTTYTFATYARNSSADWGGWSPVSLDNHIGLQAGAWIRVGGSWKMAVPYVRSGGVWKIAVPYVRNGAVWKLTS